MLKLKVKKIIKNIYFKCREKKYRQDGKIVRYFLQKNENSKDLIVVFSGFSKGKATYNYIRSLIGLEKVNKLFILDDFGWQKQGSYYLVENGDYYVQAIVLNLIHWIKAELGVEKVVCAGSSKGGTAAIMFGCLLEADAVICGAPQYYIGTYLNTKEHIEILRGMLGKNSEYEYFDSKEIDTLNNVIKESIEKCKNRPKVYIHYSEKEHTYREHIRFLMNDLMQNGYEVDKEIKDYESHEDVAKYFGDYLCKLCIERLSDCPNR